MQARVEIVGLPRKQVLELHGGHPRGNDTFHKTVSAWAGWRRYPQLGEHNGQPCSRYGAAAWLSTLQPLLASRLALAWSPRARAWADEQLAALRLRERALTETVRPEALASWRAHPAGRAPMAHQVQAIGALACMDGAALLKDDMGLGKTTSAIIAWAKSKAQRALVVCPKSVKINWQDEIALAFGDSSGSDPLIYLIDGSPSHRADIIGFMRNAMGEGDHHAVAIVNYDLLRSMNELAWSTLEAWCTGQCVIADEFHYCKDIDSKRTQSVQALMAKADLRLGLTGTPVRNTVEDLFAQIELLRPGTWVSYHDFAARHLVTSQVQFGKRKQTIVRGGKNIEELNRIVNTLSIGRKKEQVLTLPPLIRTKPQLELDGVHLEVYKQLKQFARIELEKLIVAMEGNGEETPIFHPLARSAVEAAMRCEMVAQGFLSGLPPIYADQVAPLIAGKAERIDGYPGAFAFPDSAKLSWLIDTVEQELRDRQVVVFSRFNAPILWLENKFSTQGGAVKLVGSMDTVARQEAIRTFTAGNARVMIVQVKLAEGFNLQCSTDVLFLGRDWSPALNSQAEARCHRIGTAGTVNVQIPIVHNTVEKMIERKLAAKDADAEQALATTTLRELLEGL